MCTQADVVCGQGGWWDIRARGGERFKPLLLKREPGYWERISKRNLGTETTEEREAGMPSQGGETRSQNVAWAFLPQIRRPPFAVRIKGH